MGKRALVLALAIIAANVCVSQSVAGRRACRRIKAPRPPATDRPSDPPAHAQVEGEGIKAAHQKALKALAVILPRYDASHHPLDDEIARRWCDKFIDACDPRRMYFTVGDIRRFAQHRDDLDDRAHRGDFSFAELVRDVYARRLLQTTKWGAEFLNEQHDFTVDEQFELRPAQFTADAVALRERWRKRVKYELLVEKAAALTEDRVITKLRTRYRRVAQECQLGDEELYEIFLNALARAYGPHNAYLGERTLARFRM